MIILRRYFMFRKMRRFRQQLTDEECISILKTEPRGVLALSGDDGYPYALPISHYYDEEQHKIYFHGAKEGHKIDSIDRSDKVSFCVYDKGFVKEGEWALNIKSVIVFGRLHKVDDSKKAEDICRKLGNKFYPTPESVEKEIARDFSRVLCLELDIEHMTGKLVNES